MKFVSIAILVAGMAVSITLPARADDTAPKHNCQPPLVPPQPMDRNVAATLQSGIDGYKDCIQSFVDGQQAQANRHRAAAAAAIADFNEFINTKIPKEPSK